MYFPTHLHTQNSALDGIPKNANIAELVASMGQPAYSNTDHGNMAGTVQHYKAAKKYGLLPFPGIEGYLVEPTFVGDLDSPEGKDTTRYHITLLALTEEGYKKLCALTSLSHTRPRFHKFPRFTVSDLLAFQGPDIAVLTGCLSGYFQKSLLRNNRVEAVGFAKLLAAKFPNTYIELMDHNMPDDVLVEIGGADNGWTESNLVIESMKIAEELGLPVVASQDSHYLTEEDRIAHAMMKKLTFGEGETFSGDSYHVASEEWVSSHYTGQQWTTILEGMGDLLAKNKVKISPLDNFQLHVPKIKDNAQIALTKMAFDALDKRGFGEKHEEQVAYELSVIDKLGLADYFLGIKDVVDWCRENSIMVEARGSANGSTLCFMLDITQVDPIKWNIKFERFLSLDRKKPPDIDLDIGSRYHDRVIEYVKAKYPGSVRLGSWGLLGVSKSGEGSVMVSWKMKMKDDCMKAARAEGLKGAAAAARKDEMFKEKYGMVKKADDIKKHFPKDWPGLQKLLESNSVFKGPGTTGGGMALSGEGLKIEDYVPTMLIASSDTIVTQFWKDDLEELGIMKWDLLSQVSLDLLTDTQRAMGRENPLDLSWIPDDDAEACKQIRSGRTNSGIFHAEGYTKARGYKEMYPYTTEEVCIGSALFMPGADSQRDLYIARKNDPRLRKQVKYLHPVFEQVLSPTYGCVVYQDQVIDIMRGLGMTEAGINTFFKVVKSSGKGAVAANKERLKEVQEEFADLCKSNGIEDVNKAWESTAGFVGYGFGKAHSVGYGIRAYRAAYLKAYAPYEFMTAVLNTNTDPKKEPGYVQEAKRTGMRVGLPHVNKSKLEWVLDKETKTLIRPIGSVVGVGPTTSQWIVDNAPFKSVDDLVERCDIRGLTGLAAWINDGMVVGTIKALRIHGALDGLFENCDRGDLEV